MAITRCRSGRCGLKECAKMANLETPLRIGAPLEEMLGKTASGVALLGVALIVLGVRSHLVTCPLHLRAPFPACTCLSSHWTLLCEVSQVSQHSARTSLLQFEVVPGEQLVEQANFPSFARPRRMYLYKTAQSAAPLQSLEETIGPGSLEVTHPPLICFCQTRACTVQEKRAAPSVLRTHCETYSNMCIYTHVHVMTCTDIHKWKYIQYEREREKERERERCMYTHKYLYSCTIMCVCEDTYKYVTFIITCEYIYIYTYIYMYIYIYICIYMYTYIYIYICIHMCIYIHTCI